MASFKKLKTGWEFRLRYKDPFTQKFREKSQRGFESKKEAQLAAAELEKKLSQGFEKSDITLVDFLNSWLTDYKKGTVRKNTIVLHKNNINNHIKPYFKNIMLQEVKPMMYQKFLNSLSDNNYSKRTVELVHSTMHNALEKALILGKIEKNPCNGVTIKGKKKYEGIKFIESDNIPVFLQAAYKYDYIYWIFFKALIETGVRKGEAAALQWTDVDFKNNTISITKTLDFAATQDDQLFGDPKTFNSKRIVRISNSFANDLKFHMKWQNQNKLTLKELYKHELNLVFCRDDGNFMPKSSLFNAFSRILKRAGLPSLPIHSLRHTYAVLTLESGADMKFVQEQLGHGSIQITSDIYAHISKKIQDVNIERFEQYTDGFLNKKL